MKTKQEVFDIVARHLLTQNEKSLNAEGKCVYRGSEGRKCAAGALIPDEIYNVEMEGRTIRILMEFEPDLHAAFGGSDSLAMGLQSCHDSFAVQQWPLRLVRLAAEYGLNGAVVHEFPVAS